MALVYLINKPQVSSKITRLLFLEYDLKIIYKLGRSHLMVGAICYLTNHFILRLTSSIVYYP
jgi:hypothetical protein